MAQDEARFLSFVERSERRIAATIVNDRRDRARGKTRRGFYLLSRRLA